MTQSRNIALIPGLTVGPGRDPSDPCTDEPLPYYIGRTLEPPDYQLPSIGLPAHAPSCPDQGPVMASSNQTISHQNNTLMHRRIIEQQLAAL